MEEGIAFYEVLSAALAGEKISRRGWNAPGQYVTSQYPDANSKMGAPYCYLFNAQGVNVPWTPSQGDLFATDWYVVA